MDININLSYGEESIHNLAFIKALLIKHNIEKLNISYNEKEELRKQILNELEKLGKAESNIHLKGAHNEKQN